MCLFVFVFTSAIKFQNKDFEFVNLGKIQLFNDSNKMSAKITIKSLHYSTLSHREFRGNYSFYTAEEPEIQRI